MKISDVFFKKVVSAAPGDTLAAIARLMKEHNVGAVVILDQRRPVGIVTDRDLAVALGVDALRLDTPAEKVMTRRVLAIPEDTEVVTATRYIAECGVRRLPVVDREDRVIGMVTLDDLLRLLSKELSNLADGIKREMEVR
jgi:CBS domain-containing protein